MRFVLVVLFAVSLQAEQDDWLIVPGERLGPITPSMTRASLERIFGKAHVRDKMFDPAEGPGLATVIFPETPSASLVISWRDGRMDRVMICADHIYDISCKWHTQGGITLGTSLERLETLNGRAFELSPEQGEGQGLVTSWLGGKLSDSFGEGIGRKLWIQLDIRMASPPVGITSEQRILFDQIYATGRPPLSSDLAVRQLQFVVKTMTLAFARTPEPLRNR